MTITFRNCVVDAEKKTITADDNVSYPIAHMLDNLGEDTDDFTKAAMLIIKCADNDFRVMDMADYGVLRPS